MADQNLYAGFKDTIACHVEMFSESMPIFLYRDGKIQATKVRGAEAAQLLVGLCNDQEIYRLELSGNAEYLQSFIDSIRAEENKQFGINKIEIVPTVTEINTPEEKKEEE